MVGGADDRGGGCAETHQGGELGIAPGRIVRDLLEIAFRDRQLLALEILGRRRCAVP
jgi:hypothetical protein